LLASIHTLRGELDIALEYYLKSLDLVEKKGFKDLHCLNLYHLITFFLYQNDLGETKRYFQQLKQIKDQSGTFSETIYSLARADMLKEEPDLQNRHNAESIYNGIIEDKVEFKIKIIAVFNLCDLLFGMFTNRGEGSVPLGKIQTNLNNALLFSEQKGILGTKLSLMYLQAKFELLQMNIDKGRMLFKQILVQAKKLGQDYQVKLCEIELSNLEKLLPTFTVIEQKLKEEEENVNSFQKQQVEDIRAYIQKTKTLISIP
ncbi:MAG: hypothetical protein ACFFD4_35105, partial [Candidatus Odinarchaeota archaeon]